MRVTKTDEPLHELYDQLCCALDGRTCESCGRQAQHVDPCGSLLCFDCVVADGPPATDGPIVYPGLFNMIDTGVTTYRQLPVDIYGDTWECLKCDRAYSLDGGPAANNFTACPH